jgi:hypothetical protein
MIAIISASSRAVVASWCTVITLRRDGLLNFNFVLLVLDSLVLIDGLSLLPSLLCI